LDRAEVYLDPDLPQILDNTGDGNIVPVIFNASGATGLDLGTPSAYSTSTGEYRATRSGYHSVAIQVCAVGIVPGLHTRTTLLLQQWAGAADILGGRRVNAIAPTAFSGQYATIALATEVYMDPGQVLTVSFSVGGAPPGQREVILYSSSDRYTRMEARLS